MDKLFIVVISNHFTSRNSKNDFSTPNRFISNYAVKKNSKGINLFEKPKTPLQQALAKYSSEKWNVCSVRTYAQVQVYVQRCFVMNISLNNFL